MRTITNKDTMPNLKDLASKMLGEELQILINIERKIVGNTMEI